MFGISLPELLLVLAIALLVFGPEKLPEIARSLGRWSSYIKKNSDAVRREFYNSVYEPANDIKNRINHETGELRTIKKELEDKITEKVNLKEHLLPEENEEEDKYECQNCECEDDDTQEITPEETAESEVKEKEKK